MPAHIAVATVLGLVLLSCHVSVAAVVVDSRNATDIPVVLPASSLLRGFYLTLMDNINTQCRLAAVNDLPDTHQLLIRNATRSFGRGNQPLFVPASCKRYRLVGVDAVDSPTFITEAGVQPDWPEKAIVSIRSGITESPGAREVLASMT